MALLVDLFRVFTLLNLLLLVGLGYVWGRNWLELRSKHALGLMLFAAFLLGENALAAYFFMVDPTLTAWITNPEQVPPVAQGAMMSLRVLEFGGLAFLSWITWD
jgi:hypothetical protein